jgi:pilus assembly protein CpaF
MIHECLPFELGHHWNDPAVTDVLVNNEVEVWVERSGRLERESDLRPGDIGVALQRLLTPLGRRLDRLSPMVDARLPDGTRVCAVIEPIAVGGTCAAFRIFRHGTFDLDDFAPLIGDDESIENPEWHAVRDELLSTDANVLITGATGSGKSALLGTLASQQARDDRIVVIEDTYELVIEHPNAVRLESRDPTHEGRGAIGIDELLRTALRMRPDRIVVGEVRGPEALTLVQAMSTGHRRCLATLHANSALEGLHRLDILTMSAANGWTVDDARELVNHAIGWVVHTRRCTDGRRTIDHVAGVDADSGRRFLVMSFES